MFQIWALASLPGSVGANEFFSEQFAQRESFITGAHQCSALLCQGTSCLIFVVEPRLSFFSLSPSRSFANEIVFPFSGLRSV
jgi:hypothetical protein